MNKLELIETIEELGLDTNDFYVLSSGALVLRNLYEEANDLDIAVNSKGLEHLNKKYNLVSKENNWYYINDKVECVLDTKAWETEKVGKYNVESITKYYEYLKSSTREKDKIKRKIVEDYLKKITL